MNCPDLPLVRFLFFVLGLAGPASAQLDLPKPKPAPAPVNKENTAERLLRLGEKPDVSDPTLKRRTGVPGEARRKARRQSGGLQLPSRERMDRRRRGAAQPAPQAEPVVPPVLPPPAGTQPESRPDEVARDAAAILISQVAEVRDVDDPLVGRAVERLVALGDEGLVTARVGLASPHAPVIVVSGRVLLHSSNPLDPPRVEGLLELPLPKDAIAPLLEAFVRLAPVRATPTVLGRLLCHDQAPMRHAAQLTLARLLTEESVPSLDPALDHRRADTRFRAVELLSQFDGALATDRLLQHVADGTPKVAQMSIESLSMREDPRIDHELLEQTFAERWILPQSSYALLALVEREDELLKPVLDGRHVEPLLRGMTSKDPFVRGSCASALAGIGFRSDDPGTTPWLDREVPDALIQIVASQEFFPQLSSLRRPATRRLTMIAGVSYGSNAPGWARWWLEARETFRASRAILRVEPTDVVSLQVLVQPGFDERGAPQLPFQLVGPAIEPSKVASHEGEVLFLTEEEAAGILAIAEDEGLLDNRRLPGVRGGTINGSRSVELRVANQAKSFVFGSRAREDWFERSLAACEALADRNRWQRFPTPEVYPTRHTLWKDQHVWWSMEQSPEARQARLESLVLAYAEKRTAGARELAYQELERLWQEPGLRDVSDGDRLLALLDREIYYGEEARILAHLVTQVSGFEADEIEKPPVGDPRRGSMERLIDVLCHNFSGSAAEELLAILNALGEERVRGAATDQRPLMRGLSAGLLARSASDPDIDLLLDLLKDPDLDVREAAILAAGEGEVERASATLLDMLKDAPRALRLAAMRSLGKIGGEEARVALTQAMTEPEDDVRAAAAEGLAELRDPTTAHLLVSQLLRRGRSSPAFPKVRHALLEMGEEIAPELMTAMRSSAPAAQREAALLLSELGEPLAASVLIRFVVEDPTDSLVLNELTILSCVDHRRAGDPAAAWFRWWDDVRHNDSFLWFQTAMELRDLPSPPRSEFAEGGTRQAVAFLLEGMNRKESWLSERSRRELMRMTGRHIDRDLPPIGPQRDAWLETLFEVLGESRQ